MSNTLFFAAGALAAIGMAYELRFTEATLRLGRQLAGAHEGTGVQDAITPPASTILALTIYACSIGVVAWAFVRFGFIKGLVAIFGFLVAVVVFRQVVPKPDSQHFLRRMLRSMSRRHADFVRRGDAVRAEAMAALLEHAGVPVIQRAARNSGRGA